MYIRNRTTSDLNIFRMLCRPSAATEYRWARDPRLAKPRLGLSSGAASQLVEGSREFD
jgi:hypothetical protein